MSCNSPCSLGVWWLWQSSSPGMDSAGSAGTYKLAVTHSLDHAFPGSFGVDGYTVQAGADLVPNDVVPAAGLAGLKLDVVEGQVGVLYRYGHFLSSKIGQSSLLFFWWLLHGLFFSWFFCHGFFGRFRSGPTGGQNQR